EPLTPQHNELAILEPAQHRRVQLVRRPPAPGARPATVLDGLRQRDGAAGDDDLHQPSTPARGTNSAVAPGRAVRGRCLECRRSRDGPPGRAPAPVLLRRRPGFHPGGRERRPEVTARRPRGHGRRGRGGTTGRSAGIPGRQLRSRQPRLRDHLRRLPGRLTGAGRRLRRPFTAAVPLLAVVFACRANVAEFGTRDRRRCWNTGLAGASGAHGGGTVQSGRPVSRSARGPEMCGEMVPGSTCTSKTSSTPVTGLARLRLKEGPPSVTPVAGITPELPPS